MHRHLLQPKWCLCSLDALVNTYVFLRWTEAWVFWGKNSRLVCGTIKTMGHETTRAVFQLDQDPEGGWNNRSLGILIGLQSETNANVRHWQNKTKQTHNKKTASKISDLQFQIQSQDRRGVSSHLRGHQWWLRQKEPWISPLWPWQCDKRPAVCCLRHVAILEVCNMTARWRKGH